AIRAGTAVDFPNRDRTYHNVFSFSKAKRFDLGRYAGGLSKAIRFDEPGVVRVFCEIHSHMSAFILVFAHRYFATTDAEGRYRIDDVPPGTYTVVAWNDGEAREHRGTAALVPAGDPDRDGAHRGRPAPAQGGHGRPASPDGEAGGRGLSGPRPGRPARGHGRRRWRARRPGRLGRRRRPPRRLRRA